MEHTVVSRGNSYIIAYKYVLYIMYELLHNSANVIYDVMTRILEFDVIFRKLTAAVRI